MGLMIVAASLGGREAEMKEGMGSTQYRAGHAARDPRDLILQTFPKGKLTLLLKDRHRKSKRGTVIV